ncbi:MAG: hypothetical protein ILA22_00495 [Prevotella sp.]|nr:hypothetical protein [Prevotella sp.]
MIEQLHAAYPKALIVGHHDLRSALPLGSSKNPMKDCPASMQQLSTQTYNPKIGRNPRH